VSGRTWTHYLATQSARRARTLLRVALDHFDEPSGAGRSAIDVGCGSGADTRDLLRRGWRVLAIDREPAAIQMLVRAVPPEDRPRLRVLTADFTTVPLPSADLVYCGWSLPHCPPERFGPLWSRLRASVRPSGRLAGHFLGDRDSWTAHRRMSAVNDRELRNHLDGLDIEMLTEVERDGEAFGGSKHWHYFGVVVRKPPTRRG
jgi:SAM-dependent methyltransferase